MAKTDFDRLAARYTESMSPWMRITGETNEFYAQSRITWLADQLKARGCRPHRIMDYGCGVGLATPFLLEAFGADCEITGVDASPESLEIARSQHASGHVSFKSLDEYVPHQSEDLVYCNGVFHHIPVDERDGAIRYVCDSLRPGGLFGLWENNPWNPIVRYNMAHVEIDRDANPINSRHGKRMVLSQGFTLLELRYLFIFPAPLRFLRPLEALVSRIPVGAQYVVLSRKVIDG